MVGGDVGAEHADRVFHALADATRRDIVAVVLRGEQSVSDLARRYPMSFAAVQKHVVVLERAGLVTKQRRGRELRVRGTVDILREAHRLLPLIGRSAAGQVTKTASPRSWTAAPRSESVRRHEPNPSAGGRSRAPR
jgi:DNA-binding transcriptional ArsR family regulator